jgi:hypothetical protein
VRRFAASILAGLGLLSATLAWSAFAFRFSALEPARSERVADALVKDATVRRVVANALADALGRAVPANALVSTPQVQEAARHALDDPRAVAALKTALVAAHQRLVGQGPATLRLDAGPVAAAGRDALVAAHPELARSVKTPPSLAVELPTEHLPDLGRLREPLGTASRVGALAAGLLLAVALLVAPNRPAILSRAGRWAVGAGIAWAVVGGALPWAISRVADAEPSLAVAGSLAVAVVGPMLVPALLLVATGVGAIFAGRSWQTARTTRSVGPTVAPAPVPVPSV